MKPLNTLYILLAAMVFFCSTPSRAKSVSDMEYQAVIDTAYDYFNGVANGDLALMEKAFDMEFGHMKMISVDKSTGKETVRVVPFKEFAGYFKKATQDTWTANVLSVDIVSNQMAMVKLDFNTPKTHYIDYLVMYKTDNNWRIINKTFVAEAK